MANKQTKDINKSIKNLFDNMDYGDVREKYDLAEAWLQKRKYKIDQNKKVIPLDAPGDTIDINSKEKFDQLIKNCEQQSKVWLGFAAVEKTKLLSRFADEIEKYTILICQLEMIVNNKLTKETKEVSIKILTNYLRYYARWACMIGKQYPDYVPYGLCSCYFGSGSTVGDLGLVIAPALAAGNAILLGTHPEMFHIASLLVELCENIGFPKGIITIVETPILDTLLTHIKVRKITYFGNLYEKSYIDVIASTNKHSTLAYISPKTTVVFDTADIDSACDSVVHSALTWTSQGSLLYVQETIFNEFTQKFKTKIEKLNVGYDATQKMLDIVINEKQKLPEDIELINKLPIRIGNKSFGNNVITKDNNDVLSIVPFRTANEAITLVNNTSCPSNVSLWTENLSLANEMTSKLKTGVILINTDYQLNANASFSLYKDSGCGYFGGKEGLEEYLRYNKSAILYDTDLNYKYEESNISDVRNFVEIAKKAYESWNKLQPKVRGQLLWKLAENSGQLKNEKWIECLQEWSILCDSTESVVQQGSPALRIIKESIGILVIELFDASDTCLNLIAAALAYGNAIIIVWKDTSHINPIFLNDIRKILSSIGIPIGVLNVLYTSDANLIPVLVNFQDIQACFVSDDTYYKFKFSHKIRSYHHLNINYTRDILKCVTKNKCVWTSVGESFL